MEIFLKLIRQTAMWVDISQGRRDGGGGGGGSWGSSDAPYVGGHFIYLIPSYAPEIPILKVDEYRIHFIYKYIHSVEAKEITLRRSTTLVQYMTTNVHILILLYSIALARGLTVRPSTDFL